MDRTERFYLIDQMLGTGQSVPINELLDRLGVSIATFKRDLEYLRDRLNAPIVWDRDTRGYRFEKIPAPWDKTRGGPRYELPGLWFSPQEAFALLTMQQLLKELQPGLLTPHIQPLMQRLELLLGQGEFSAREIHQRIRILQQGKRRMQLPSFEVLASALLKRQRVKVIHYSRERDEALERILSPQRLVHYRDNWYLDAWCHTRKDLRTFGVDVIQRAELLDTPAKSISNREMDERFQASYGIFSGKAQHTAILRFTPARARWVAQETWHPQQTASFEGSGHYRLEVPYSDDRELIMDILKHGTEVEVLGPPALRERVGQIVQAVVGKYAGQRQSE